jgi:hypothetical protein
MCKKGISKSSTTWVVDNLFPIDIIAIGLAK